MTVTEAPSSSSPSSPSSRSSAELPGPRGGLKIPAGTDRLTAYRDAIRNYGEIVCFSEEPRVFLVQHPDHVKHVLLDNHTNYRQNTRQKILMGGQSLALSSGEPWRHRRRLLQPIFNQQRLAAMAPGMVAGTQRMLDRWRGHAGHGGRGEPLDVAQEMTGLTLDLLIETLLGNAAGRGGLRKSVTTAFEYFNDRLRNPRTLPVSVPTPRNLRLLAALSSLRRAVRKAVEEHREKGPAVTGGGDLLSLMIAAHDEQTGAVMNAEQLLDELMMLLVMGHMTTAMAATWTFYMLSRHPEAEERMRAEIADVLGGRPPGFGDVAKLVYTRMVIEETMRLYPPSWGFSRFALGDDEIGGYRIPAGSVVTLTPWLTHRRADLWEDPDRFDPERFAPNRSGVSGAERPRFAYYPFGGGPRICIARDLALMELPLILSSVFQRYRLRAVPGHPVAVVQGITLRPRAGLRMTLEDPAAPPKPKGTRPFETLPAALLLKPETNEIAGRARRIARALAAQGISPGERIGLLLAGGPDWVAADLGAMAVGAVTVPLEAGADANLLNVRTVIADRDFAADGVRVLPFQTLLGQGEGPELEDRIRQRRADEPATVILTPGTSGEPKAVELTHGNLAAAAHKLAQALGLKAGETALSGRPLTRPAERVFVYACLLQGTSVAFPGPGSLEQELRRVRPHVFSSTPDFWKEFLNATFQAVQSSSPRKRRLFQAGVQLGRQSVPFRVQRRRPHFALAWRLAVVERLVFSKLRQRLGGRLRCALSGGDRITHGWITMLWGAGIPVYESYGLAEAAGIVTVNTPGAVRPGTAGVPLPGVEIQIAEDGEILVRGETVAPHSLGTEGWLHTGDSGWIDDSGMLNVFGRLADLYTGMGGKKVSPGGLESLFRASHFVSQAVMVGDGRPYNGLLIAPDLEVLKRAASRRNIAYSSTEDLLRDSRVREIYAREIQGVNDKLAPHDQVRTWELLPRELTVEAGELTPAGTVRRAVVLERWAEAVERLYNR